MLHTAEHPTITFRSTRITGTPQSFEITGELSIKGRTHPVTAHGKGNGAGPLRGWATALRLADEVRVEFEVARLEPADGPGLPPHAGQV